MDCSSQEHQKKVVIVTGASRGLGRHIALVFAAAGCRVMVTYATSHDRAAGLVQEILRSGGEGTLHRADVRSEQEVDTLFARTVMQWGAVDVVINNAGINKDGLHIRMPEHDWEDVIATNLTGAFHMIRSASRVMMRQGCGHIINISSITGIQGRPGQANYSASKAGLIGLTKSAARELGPSGIQVNAVLPGFLMTDMGNAVSEDMKERMLREHCLDRTSDPVEVARFIHHLSGMKNVSGQVFNLDSRIL
jgi:3-oxoacyl-[acyl-carrier protein] reductase